MNKKCSISIISQAPSTWIACVAILSVTSCLMYFSKNGKCQPVEGQRLIHKIDFIFWNKHLKKKKNLRKGGDG